MTIVFWALFVFFNVPTPWRLTLFFPAMMSTTGFLQAYFHFCAAFGFKGLYNVAKPAGKTETVEQKEAHQKDRQKALQIILFSVLLSIVITLVTYSV